jgi:hypothetical protein
MMMRLTEEYRGFRIEAEAEPLETSVLLKIFALEKDGSADPKAEPMNVQTFEPSAETPAGTAELMQASLSHARSGIDALLTGGQEAKAAERPRHEIVDDARDGKPGRLTVPFVATAPEERLSEMVRVLDSAPLDGLRAKILMNARDFDGQPTPEERPDLIGVEVANEVAEGEFHLLLKPILGAGTIIRH